MTDTFFKGYWLVTNRCNLACGYCVLEDAPEQLQRELDLAGKLALVTHLYQRLGFRRITLSGGEVLLIGKRPPTDFVHLLRHLKTFRSTDPRANLEVEVYTNGTLLDDAVADEMVGVVDLVAVTIDSASHDVLTQLGRNRGRDHGYFQRAVEVCERLSSRGIGVKLHSVVGAVNHTSLPDDVTPILDAIEHRGGRIATWKFYQYMSYDAPAKDSAHAITATAYAAARDRIAGALAGRGIRLHFKDTGEMAASMFNILSYGNAQYQRPGDTWSTTRRTDALESYASMAELFARHDLDESTFRRFHELER